MKFTFLRRRILPCLAYGKSPDSKPFNVVLHQMSEKVCPHYSDKGYKIYKSRPRNCRVFPFIVIPFAPMRKMIIEPDKGCSWSIKLRERFPENPPKNILSQNSEEFRLAIMIQRKGLELSYIYKGQQEWWYDVIDREWIKENKEKMLAEAHDLMKRAGILPK
jgi:Fe-S-cluster containining protein